MAEEWYYLKGNQQVGPISRDALREAVTRGDVTGETYVWSEGMAQWSLARELPDLLPPTGPAPAPPWPPEAPAGQPPLAIPYARGAKPASHMLGAILTLIFCCLPFGIVATVYAAQVDGKYARGDYAGAERASSSANLWMWLAFGVGLVFHMGWNIRRTIH